MYKIVLHDILHVPRFKFNLLLVNKLSKTSLVKLISIPHLQREETLAAGKVVGNFDVLVLVSFFFNSVHSDKISLFLNILFQAIMCLTLLYLFGTRNLVIFLILFCDA